MDPNTAYWQMCHEMWMTKDYRAARELAKALKEWFTKGGYYPCQWSKVEMDMNISQVLWKTIYLDLPEEE